MKIGVLLTIYNCEKYVDACLSPWFKLKEKYDIVIASSSGMFFDYLLLDIPYRNQKTLELLSKYDIDFQITTKSKHLLVEDASRNLCLDYLINQNCDLLWVVDGDEMYTEEQIENMLKFVQDNPDYDYYSIIFKTLTIQEHLFVDYINERIAWIKKHGGVKSFYFDNKFIYNDGTYLLEGKGLEIPKNVAYVLHSAWISNDTRSRDKIKYQRYRYNGGDGSIPEYSRCAYEWNEEKNRLEFSEKFYRSINVEIPMLHEQLSCYSTDFSIDFSRVNNRFYINKIMKNMIVGFEIYNGDTSELIYKCDLDLQPDIQYFIAPDTYNIFDANENFYSFEIKVLDNNVLIHHEKHHLKLKD